MDCDKRRAAIAAAESIDGFMERAEMEWLYDNARGLCVEVGTLFGRSAIAIASKLKEVGGQLYCVDLWTNDANLKAFRQNIAALDLPIHALRLHSLQAAGVFCGTKCIDFVFIDSSHEYSATLAEILAWAPKVKDNGLLCGHDFGNALFPGVERAVRELCPQSFSNPVGWIWSCPAFTPRPTQAQVIDILLQRSAATAYHDHKFSSHMTRELGLLTENLDRLTASLNRKDDELRQVYDEVAKLRNEIQAMRSSKFWKLRDLWHRGRRLVG